MLRNLPGIIVICAGIAGCATKPATIVADTTPVNRTAVIEHQIVNNGIMGMFPFEGTDLHYVRTNMRRDESTVKGTGTFSGFLIGTRSDADIIRLDRKVKWSLNTEKAEYTECPLKGCVKPSKVPPKEKQPAQQPPEAKHEPGCTMRIAHTSFTVKSTGQKKTINGFETNEYQVAWVVNLHDKESRNTTSALNIDIWTTPMSGAMRDALSIEEDFDRAYNGAVAETGKQQILPADASKLISAYLVSMMKSGDLKAFLDAGRQLEKIKGYPISTHLDWSLEGNACAPKEAKQAEAQSSSPSAPTSVSGLVSGFAGMFAQKKTEDSVKAAAAEPILSFSFEVKKLAIEPVHDSEFMVPKNYKLVSQP